MTDVNPERRAEYEAALGIGVSEDVNVTIGIAHQATTMTLSLGAPADKP